MDLILQLMNKFFDLLIIAGNEYCQFTAAQL